MATESKPAPTVALPEKLGRHEIIASLGQGGMAQVFLAVQRGPFAASKLLVIKKLNPDAGSDQEFVNMFVDEARVAMRLSHPNVVSTFDFVTEADTFYLAMEFLDGRSLLQTIRKVGRAQMPLELHIWILTQVLAGLAYAHGLRDFDGTPLNIVHRDVTPSNVILTYGGGVKLVDFGIAKVAGAVAVTQNGTMKGKLGYIAPEQCLGKPTTARSDIFSVGIMLWEALARRRRTVGETPAAIYQARITGVEPAIEDVWLDVPPALARTVRRALASAPENRYDTAAEFQRDLDEYLAGFPRESFGTRALSEFMTAQFTEEMRALHRTIESRVAGAARALTVVGSGPIDRRRSTESSTPLTVLSGPPVSSDASGPKPLPRRVLKIAAPLAGLGLLATVASLALHRPASQTGRAAGPVAASAPRQPPGGPEVAALAPPVAAAPADRPPVHPASAPGGAALPSPPAPDAGLALLRVVVRPRSAKAQVRLDGESLAGNPFTARHAKDRGTHTLAISADGYQPVERSVTFERDVDLTVKLPRSASEAPLVAASRAGVARPPGFARVARAAAERDREPSEGPRARPESVIEPGMELRRDPDPTTRARHIDEKDPYTP